MCELRPQSCLGLGLECATCVAGAATHIAALCPTLRGQSLEATFFQIFADPGCAPALSAFEASYFECLGLHRAARAASARA